MLLLALSAAVGEAAMHKDLLGTWKFVAAAPGKPAVRGTLEFDRGEFLRLMAEFHANWPEKDIRQTYRWTVTDGKISVTPARGPMQDRFMIGPHFLVQGDVLYLSDRPITATQGPTDGWSHKLVRAAGPFRALGTLTDEEKEGYREAMVSEIAEGAVTPGLYRIDGRVAAVYKCKKYPPTVRAQPCISAVHIAGTSSAAGEASSEIVAVPLHGDWKAGEHYRLYLTLYSGYQRTQKNTWFHPFQPKTITVNRAERLEDADKEK